MTRRERRLLKLESRLEAILIPTNAECDELREIGDALHEIGGRDLAAAVLARILKLALHPILAGQILDPDR
jgi:hypothetical protein